MPFFPFCLAQQCYLQICVTIICGLPGSHADLLCASLVALHKEKVRWVVVKVQSKHGDATTVDEEHLQVGTVRVTSLESIDCLLHACLGFV